MTTRRPILVLVMSLLLPAAGLAGTGQADWMVNGKYGMFMHYQYRILLNYSIRTDPIVPDTSEMTAEQWNRFVDGFDVRGFAGQMAEAEMGWVIFCIDVYHRQGDANQFTDQELIDWIKTCNRQGGVCTFDWPFDPKTGLIKDFGMKQMIAIRDAVKGM